MRFFRTRRKRKLAALAVLVASVALAVPVALAFFSQSRTSAPTSFTMGSAPTNLISALVVDSIGTGLKPGSPVAVNYHVNGTAGVTATIVSVTGTVDVSGASGCSASDYTFTPAAGTVGSTFTGTSATSFTGTLSYADNGDQTSCAGKSPSLTLTMVVK